MSLLGAGLGFDEVGLEGRPVFVLLCTQCPKIFSWVSLTVSLAAAAKSAHSLSLLMKPLSGS